MKYQLIMERKVNNSSTTPHIFDGTLGPTSDLQNFFKGHPAVVASAFFRLPDLFKDLEQTVFPFLQAYAPLTIWSAGCSDGREVYSLAFALDTWAQKNLPGGTIAYSIHGSDISHEQITAARKGVYHLRAEEARALQSYGFLGVKAGEHFEIPDDFKKHVTFREEDFRSLSPKPSYHIIICSNVMLYYQPDYRKTLALHLAGFLKQPGFLYIESLGTQFMRSNGWERLYPSSRFFTRRETLAAIKGVIL